jgi:hypothetical protein
VRIYIEHKVGEKYPVPLLGVHDKLIRGFGKPLPGKTFTYSGTLTFKNSQLYFI